MEEMGKNCMRYSKKNEEEREEKSTGGKGRGSASTPREVPSNVPTAVPPVYILTYHIPTSAASERTFCASCG